MMVMSGKTVVTKNSTTVTDEQNEFQQLLNEEPSVVITGSDTDAIYVETANFDGKHRINYNRYEGPQLQERGLYYTPSDSVIEFVPPWFDEIQQHFEQHYGGSIHSE